jgi:hypothetical protein
LTYWRHITKVELLRVKYCGQLILFVFEHGGQNFPQNFWVNFVHWFQIVEMSLILKLVFDPLTGIDVQGGVDIILD